MGGTFYRKVFSFFHFGDRKCRFRDIGIRPNSSEFGRIAIATYETYDNFLGCLCPIYTSTFSELMGHSRQIPWCSFFAFSDALASLALKIVNYRNWTDIPKLEIGHSSCLTAYHLSCILYMRMICQSGHPRLTVWSPKSVSHDSLNH